MKNLSTLSFLLVALTGTGGPQGTISPPFETKVPKTWDDRAMQDVELPLAREDYSPKHVPAAYYYRIPVRPIYVSYPVYHPDREPAGYVDWLRRQEPKLAWDRSKLKTKEDWIRAGEIVFAAPIGYGGIAARSGEDLYVRDRSWHNAVRPPVTKDGVLPAYRPPRF